MRGLLAHNLAANLFEAPEVPLAMETTDLPWFLWLCNVSGVEALLLTSIASVVRTLLYPAF